MLGFGFTSSAPTLFQTIPDQYRLPGLCHRSQLYSQSRIASIAVLNTVLCTNPELPRKRGRPKGSRNKSKSKEGQKRAEVLSSTTQFRELSEEKDRSHITAEKKPGQAEAEKQVLDAEGLSPTDLDQIAKKQRPNARRNTQSAELSEGEVGNNSHHGVENTHTPPPLRKRGQIPTQKAHDTPYEDLPPEGLESSRDTRTVRKGGPPRRLKGHGHDDITNTDISSEGGGNVHKPSNASNKSSKSRSKGKRGRPRMITNEFEQRIIAESLGSTIGNSQDSPPKPRKRGRPRGSKNKPKATPSVLGVPNHSRVENAEADAEDEAESDLLDLFERYNKSRIQDFQKHPQQSWKEDRLIAPNGLPGSGPDDFIFELMPLIAKMEAEENRVVSEKEKNIRRFMDKVFEQFASSHRSDRRQLNLKPFRLREDEKKVCIKCEGFGMVKCEYCEAYGFVDFGEGAERFYEEFGNNNVPLPKHVMGTMYYCPYCDGSSLEECGDCSGTGSIADRFSRKPGASRTPVNNYAKEEFNLDAFLEEEEDRIDVGLDGSILLRARKRRRPKNVDFHRIRTGKPSAAQNEKQPVPQERPHTPSGYPSPTISPAMSRLRTFLQKKGSAPLQGASRRTKRNSRYMGSTTTDFVHTTDYKVGRNLSQKKPIQFSPKKENIENDENNSNAEPQ